MKLTMLLLTASILNVSATGLSQNVTFSGKNVTLSQVLNEVKKQTGYVFFCDKAILAEAKLISVEAVNQKLVDFLSNIFKDQPLKYLIENRAVVISRKAATNNMITDLNSTGEVLAPPGEIQGRVTNENGDPLAGANVMVKGSNAGATTDNNGYFKISTIAIGNYTIVASFIGYVSKTVAISVTGNGTTINFSLVPSLVNLDEMTVTSTLSKRAIRSYPGTIAEIKGKDLQNRNINNIANVLEAVPGIIITPGSEMNNSGASRQPDGILIRGTSAGAPIKYLVDGIEIVSVSSGISILQTMDPNSIEKIEILKGPMASTLYGNGAAGGIISITTKKGRGGKARVNFKTMFTQYANDYANYSGYSQDYSANISGGGEQFNYMLGAGYNLYPTTKLSDTSNGIDQKTRSYNARIGGKVKNVAADLSLQYANETYGVGSTFPSLNKYRASLGLSQFPIFPITDTRFSQKNFLTSIHLTHTIAGNWYHDLTVGYNITNNTSPNYSANPDGTYLIYEYLYSKFNVRYFMFYDHSWSTSLKTSITSGFEYNGYETHFTGLNATTPLTNFFTSYTPGSIGAGSYTKSPYSSTGYFAEAVTGLNNHIFLTTGIRYDVNPAYGDKVGAYAQPRVGLSYVLEPGKFKLKPRVVWGVSSTPPDPTYKITTISTTSPDYTFVITGNPDIKPQRSEGYEFGADIFYGSNYSLNITYYDQKINDMIQSSEIDDFSSTPYVITTYYYNLAKAINRGLEVSAKVIVDPFTLDLSYTQTVSKWGNVIGQTPDALIYPYAPSMDIPKRSIFAHLACKVPSFLPWTKKGGNISLDWRNNGSSFSFAAISYNLDRKAWLALPTPRPPAPVFSDYYIWQKSYSWFNLRADYSIANFATLYVDVQNLLDKQGSLNGQNFSQFPGRRISFGFNVNF